MAGQLRRQLLALVAGAAAVTAGGTAYAHHSFAMFDAEKKVELDGIVKEFQWTNPHAWIMVNVAGEQGTADAWAIEMNGPSGLVRQGWKPKTLTPGMPIKLVIHPLKDGTHGGQFMAVTLPDGTQLGNSNGREAALGAGETQ
jgi:Family of unknown function (DUF6152)